MGAKTPITVFGYTVRTRSALFKAIGRADIGAKRIKERYGSTENYLREVLNRTDEQIVDMLKRADFVSNEYTVLELTTFAVMQQALREYVANHNVEPDQSKFSVYSLATSGDFPKDLTNFIIGVYTRIH